MPKKKFSPSPNGDGHKLTRQFIMQRADMLRARQVSEVPVPSFGDDMTVNVKGMTVADKNLMNVVQREGHDALSIIAALCAVDDDGRLVFGETKAEAIAMVENLPEHMRVDVAVIAMEAMKLSGRPPQTKEGDDPEETAVEDAEKN